MRAWRDRTKKAFGGIGMFFVGVALACLMVFTAAQLSLWLKHRDDAPACVNGEPPKPYTSCVVVYPAFKPQ